MIPPGISIARKLIDDWVAEAVSSSSWRGALRRGCIFSVKKSRMISPRMRRWTGEPDRDSSWLSAGKR